MVSDLDHSNVISHSTSGKAGGAMTKKIDSYGDAFAQANLEEGKTCRLWDLIVRPPVRFFKSYIFKAGFLDGRQGFILAGLGAFYVFIKHLKLWELEQKGKDAKGE